MEKTQEQLQVAEEAAGVDKNNTPSKRPVEEVKKIQSRLDKLGFKKAVSTMDKIQRMSLAYEKYMFVSQEKINKFNDKLRIETLKEDAKSRIYKHLAFTPIGDYGKVPPDKVLDKLEAAQNTGIFDSFEVAYIEWVKEVKDPIIFGRINGCDDRFFISQWDDDVKVEDIIFMK